LKVEYELTKDDILDFNLNHAYNSKAVQKILFFQRCFIPIILLAAVLILSFFNKSTKSYLPAIVVGAFLWQRL
jgi:hypothetical protein